MVREYFILNTTIEGSNPDFYCFYDPLELRSKISKAFLNEDSKWEQVKTSKGFYFLQCFYNSLEGDIKIEIIKTQELQPYAFKLTVNGGTDPLYEVARLCKMNSWLAFDSKLSTYLDINNPPQIIIDEADRKKHNDDYWETFNAVQQEEEQRKIDLQENPITPASKMKWWKFWK